MGRPVPGLPGAGLTVSQLVADASTAPPGPPAGPSVTVLGIRHHGPGSARSVLLALEELQPDLVLVEGVPELDPVLPLLGEEGMEPPVAGLVHAVDEPGRALFYPLASFSPEWVALRWALARGVPARHADLAATHVLALERDLEEAAEDRADPLDGHDPSHDDPPDDGPADDGPALDADPTDADPDAPDSGARGGSKGSRATRRRVDALAELAAAAGYDDPERWWEDAVEHRSTSSLQRFATVAEAMAAVREGRDPVAPTVGPGTDTWTLTNARREAAMRQAVRAGWKAGHTRIAFVCGAYHAPAVDPTGRPAAADSRLLTRLAKVKVAATWVPWTTGRLSRASGYGAGVTSPGWYQHLFEHWQSGPSAEGADLASTSWLVRTARALREEGLDASPASVLEATRLAETLAVLRGRPSVGLEELLEATQAVLCEGSPVPLRLVSERLVVGSRLGQVPEGTPMAPVAEDLARQQRTLRLKVSAEEKVVELDLRRDAGRARSVLFHRLRALDVDWATPLETGGTLGTFKEAWSLRWRPELSVTLVEAGLHGTTVESAAVGRLTELAREADGLGELAALIERCLLAELGAALQTVVARVDEQAAHGSDVLALLTSVAPMARTRRYGDVREVDTGRVGEVLLTVVRRACVGLRAACSSLDDDAAARMRTAVESAHDGIALLDDEELAGPWRRALQQVAADDALHGSVGGRANRMLLDAGALPAEEVARRLSRRLSPGADPLSAAGFLDGLLAGDALLLVHEPTLLRLVDGWLAEVGSETFDALLPLLRRTFADFAPAERRTIGQQLTTKGGPEVEAETIDAVRADPAVQALARLMGLSGRGSA